MTRPDGFDHAVAVTLPGHHKVLVLTASAGDAEQIATMVRSAGCVTEAMFDLPAPDRTWSR